MDNTPIKLNPEDAYAGVLLIQEYLFQGGAGHNAWALERLMQALKEAKIIIIER